MAKSGSTAATGASVVTGGLSGSGAGVSTAILLGLIQLL